MKNALGGAVYWPNPALYKLGVILLLFILGCVGSATQVTLIFHAVPRIGVASPLHK